MTVETLSPYAVRALDALAEGAEMVVYYRGNSPEPTRAWLRPGAQVRLAAFRQLLRAGYLELVRVRGLESVYRLSG